jgi:hypothetical protein
MEVNPMEVTPDDTPWDDTLFAELPIYVVYCPHCDGDGKPARSPNNGDGTRTRRLVCVRCGKRYRVVVPTEPLPFAGNWTDPRA